jgi:putative ABC transport system ATP-binding protein
MDLHVTVISATHDHKMLNLCNRVAWIRDGAIERIELREHLKITVGRIDGQS